MLYNLVTVTRRAYLFHDRNRYIQLKTAKLWLRSFIIIIISSNAIIDCNTFWNGYHPIVVTLPEKVASSYSYPLILTIKTAVYYSCIASTICSFSLRCCRPSMYYLSSIFYDNFLNWHIAVIEIPPLGRIWISLWYGSCYCLQGTQEKV